MPMQGWHWFYNQQNVIKIKSMQIYFFKLYLVIKSFTYSRDPL